MLAMERGVFRLRSVTGYSPTAAYWQPKSMVLEAGLPPFTGFGNVPIADVHRPHQQGPKRTSKQASDLSQRSVLITRWVLR